MLNILCVGIGIILVSPCFSLLDFGGNLMGLSVAWACIHQAKQFMTIQAVRAFPVPITPDGSSLAGFMVRGG